MLFSDLNVLETVENANIIGGIANRTAKTNLSFYEYVNIDKYFKARADIHGNHAFSEADAYAYGENTLAQGLTYAWSDPYGSEATSTSVAVSDGYKDTEKNKYK